MSLAAVRPGPLPGPLPGSLPGPLSGPLPDLLPGRRPRLLLVSLLTCLAIGLAPAAEDDCPDGRALSHAFDSGAAWSLCARLDDRHGLELRELLYRAPGDHARPVLESLHLAQILLHWHDAPTPERRIGGDGPDADGLGGAASVVLGPDACAGEAIVLPGRGDADGRLCARERPSGLLAKHDRHAALQGERWELFAVARQGSLIWRTGVTLAEDGSIAPSLALSGRSVRQSEDGRYARPSPAGEAGLVGAALRVTWRLAFSLDTEVADRVEEFDFPLDAGNRRPMRVRPLLEETLRHVDRERFRGWRILDGASGAGYFLDPLDNALAWDSPGGDWARFDLAVTRAADCERHASGNRSAPGEPSCGAGLDAFVDGESLLDADPVLWPSRTRNWVPRREDLPYLSSVPLETRIVPFDWTDASPFELGE